jgi:sialic acid synthase SpsE
MIWAMLELVGFIHMFDAFPAEQPWGWSSHTRGWLDCWLAAKWGASVIEKHLALSPDDIEAGHSLLPHEFHKMTRAING